MKLGTQLIDPKTGTTGIVRTLFKAHARCITPDKTLFRWPYDERERKRLAQPRYR